jgi:hypothetical protein
LESGAAFQSMVAGNRTFFDITALANIGAWSVASCQAGPKVTEVLETAPLDIKDEDTQLIKLKKMRFNAAISEAKERYALFKKGQAKFPDLVDVGQRVLTAQADLAQSPEERAQVLDKQLQVFAEAEDNLDKQVKEGKGLAADLDRLRYERFGVEIDLEILRKGMSQ